jgi:hypothetical protein
MNQKHIFKGVAILAVLALLQALFANQQSFIAAAYVAVVDLFTSNDWVDSFVAAAGIAMLVYLVVKGSEGFADKAKRINDVGVEFVAPLGKLLKKLGGKSGGKNDSSGLA